MSDQEQRPQDDANAQRPADEQNQNQAGDADAAADAGDADKSSDAAGSVTVIHGANNQKFDNLAGSTVGDVRDTLTDVFNIPQDAQALVNGENAGGNYRLRPEDTLEFIRQAGVKG